MTSTICLGEVEAAFVLSGRQGVVVIPAQAWAADITVGQTLRLLRPDGTAILVRLAGVEMSNPPSRSGKRGLYLKTAFTPEHSPELKGSASPVVLALYDVPVGSTLWHPEDLSQEEMD